MREDRETHIVVQLSSAVPVPPSVQASFHQEYWSGNGLSGQSILPTPMQWSGSSPKTMLGFPNLYDTGIVSGYVCNVDARPDIINRKIQCDY